MNLGLIFSLTAKTGDKLMENVFDIIKLDSK